MPEQQREQWAAALERGGGREYWRSLEELLETAEFRAALEREFPAGAAELGGMSRRDFVRLLGASLALAGVGGCIDRPKEKILPYVKQPADLTPGVAQHYATSMVLGGYATGLLVESRAGRPTKVEGNPDHPASLGAAGVYEQASVLQLYDPHRAREVRFRGRPAQWTSLAPLLRPAAVRQAAGAHGAGLRIVLEPTSSPLMAELIGRVRELYPEAGFHFYAPLASAEPYAGATASFGRIVQPQYRFRDADVILALDADFLASMPFHLRYAREFAEQRRVALPSDSMNRLYAVEAMLTPTGAAADHRLALPASAVQRIAAAVLAEVVLGLGARPAGLPAELDRMLEPHRVATENRAWIQAVARDLAANRGRAIVIAGDRQPAAVHALTHLLNAALGNAGRTVVYTDSPILGAGDESRGLMPLVEAMHSGDVELLLILQGNPSYTAPADVEFSRWLRAVPSSVYLGLFQNETAADCGWFVPARHYLEAWGDARAYDGTVSFVQPLIAPLYGGRAPIEMLGELLSDGGGQGASEPETSGHDRLQTHWRSALGAAEFDESWDRMLQRGFIPDSALPAAQPAFRWDSLAAAIATGGEPEPAAGTLEAGALELEFLQDSSLYDGRFANNAWLQELPDPMTKLTWDNAALLSPRTAARLGASTGDFLRLRHQGRELRIPAFVLPGHADHVVSLPLGYGREAAGELVGQSVGFNAYRIRTSDALYFASGASVERAGDGAAGPSSHPLATTQTHWAMEGRPVVLHATLEEYRQNPDFTKQQRGRVLSLYEPYRYTGDQWAMVIDLSTCTGCNACVVACQAENNVPVVGKEGVLDGREMHWLRLDRYFSGSADEPAVLTQPMLCQHCEKAPCEYVCPVNATVHSPDGLNEMVYNRCVGTRFCSNNCPYKVRRFNWFDYNAEVAETERMVKNPEVTVRARGVMEKCTFCVQRIRNAQIEAQVENRPLRGDEVQTACQQSCPTRAIVFGSYTDPDSEVAQRRAEPRIYSVLHELGTEPRVQYLARITNPNPALRGDADAV